MAARRRPARRRPAAGARVKRSGILGGWYVVSGPHDTPLSGKFATKAEAQAWLRGRRGRR